MFNRAGVLNSYSHHVKVGNWSEEQELQELKMKEYIHKKENGTLLVHHVQKHLNTCLQEVGLSYSHDNFIHIGDHIMLYSVQTEGVLSCDPSDKLASIDGSFAVTTSTLTKAHVARNTFIIESYGKESKVGDILKLGQYFRLRLNNKLCDGEAYYLHSQPVTATAASKVTRKQEVSMVADKSFDTVWKVMWKDITKRFENEGTPVPANSEIVIVHGQTQQALSSDKHAYFNDFGLEYEVSAHSKMDIRKSQGLYAELQGRTTTDIPFRKERSPNHWAFLTAAHPEMEKLLTTKSRLVSAEQQEQGQLILLYLREQILHRGPTGVHELSKAFRLADPQKTEVLPYDYFFQILRQHATLNDEQIRCLVIYLDPTQQHVIDYTRFMNDIRGGTIKPKRLQLVYKAFDMMVQSGTDYITLQTLGTLYNTTQDPEVKNGKKTKEQVTKELLSRFDAYNGGSGRVTRDEWVDYYSTVSTFVENDDYFTYLMTNWFRITDN